MCNSNLRRLCNEGDCEQCFEKSFASHKKAKFWSKENEVSPRHVFKSSHKKYNFDCECGHTFEISPDKITHERWFPYCANPPKKLCEEECKQCFEKSFASHEKAKFWSKENEVFSRDVFKSSGKKYNFDCPFCKRIYKSTLDHVSRGK